MVESVVICALRVARRPPRYYLTLPSMEDLPLLVGPELGSLKLIKNYGALLKWGIQEESQGGPPSWGTLRTKGRQWATEQDT
jgi:hypothetical protein